jgi:hypothetical protein
MAVTTPYLRARYLFRSPNDVTQEGDIERLPFIALSLYILLALAVDAGMSDVTFQTVNRLLGDQGPLLWLLGHLDARVLWRQDRKVQMHFTGSPSERGAYAKIVRRIAAQRFAKKHETLGAMIVDQIPRSTLERVAFLRRLGYHLAPNVIAARHEVGGRTRVRPYIEQFVVSCASETVLATLAERGVLSRHTHERT